jgi:hypothetical protein
MRFLQGLAQDEGQRQRQKRTLATISAPTTLGEGSMHDVSRFRLYLLRAYYLLLAVGLGLMIWPRLISHTTAWALKNGDTFGLLSGVQLLAILGLRYPLRMLPLLLFELTWKSIWLLTIAVPLWRANEIDPGTAESIKACGMGVIISLVAIPWDYVAAKFVREAGDRWR